MTHAWTAEAVVDEALARRLLAQFPDLEVESLRLLSEGWDRAIWVVNEAWAFGFPRRAVAVEGLEREIALLPRLAPLLPLPIPVPVFAGSPADGFPWPFAGSALIPGAEVWDAELDEGARTAVALELARFLRRLHGEEIAAALGDELPLDANRRALMALRVPKLRALLERLDALGIWTAPPALTPLLDDAEQLAPSARLAVCHGDLHVRHLLVDGGRASGVIDWIDLCRSDPAIDLHLLWSFVPAASRDAFLAAYGPVAEDQLLRARVLALMLCGILAEYAHAEGQPDLLAEAVAGLDRASETA